MRARAGFEILFSLCASLLGVGVGCGGSAAESPGHDAGPLADVTTQGSDSSASNEGGDAAAGVDARTASDAAGNTGNGQDCTACVGSTPVCCVTYGAGGVQSVACVAAQSACPSGTGGFACTGPAGCTGGLVCCETGLGTTLSTSCASACPSANRVCQAPTDCPTASDCPMDGTRGDIGYGVCTPLPEAGPRIDSGNSAGDGGNGPSDGGADGPGSDAGSDSATPDAASGG